MNQARKDSWFGARNSHDKLSDLNIRDELTRMVGWLIGFCPQAQRKGIVVSSKAHVSPPTHIVSDQGDPLVVRLGSCTQATCMEG